MLLTRQHPPATAHHRAAITLPELLTVMLVGVFLLLIALPVINAMRKDMTVSTAANTVSVAVASARARAGVFAEQQFILPGSSIPESPRGAAAVFTPNNDIRIAIQYPPMLTSGGNVLMRLNNAPTNDQNRLGFADEDNFDYIRLPSRSLAFGLMRDSTTGNNLWLIPPPFAIYFDQEGILRVGETNSGNVPDDQFDNLVYYTPDQGGTISLASVRNASYAPYTWFENQSNYAENNQGIATLPFSRLETVVGVVVCDRNKFEEQFGNLATILTYRHAYGDAPSVWLMDPTNTDSRVLLFNRYTGAVIREEARP